MNLGGTGISTPDNFSYRSNFRFRSSFRSRSRSLSRFSFSFRFSYRSSSSYTTSGDIFYCSGSRQLNHSSSRFLCCGRHGIGRRFSQHSANGWLIPLSHTYRFNRLIVVIDTGRLNTVTGSNIVIRRLSITDASKKTATAKLPRARRNRDLLEWFNCLLPLQ